MPSLYYKSDDEEKLNDELFLSEVPVSLIKHSIEQQFQCPLDYRKKDYIEIFMEKFQFSKENMYEDDLPELEIFYEDFLKFMMQLFDEYLDIGIVDLDLKDEDEQFNLLQIPYRFFIRNIKKNFVTLIMNYMEAHKTEIVDTLPKRKDVTTNRLREEIDNEDDIAILANLDEVIKYVLDQEMDVDQFLELCTPDETVMELEYVKVQFDEFTLTGNFVEKYKNFVNDEFRSELESKLRNKILKKYPHGIVTKQPKNDDNEPYNEED